MPAWYPSLVVNFRLRFDEAYTTFVTPQPVSTDDLSGGDVVAATTAANAILGLPLPGQVDIRPLVTRRGVDNLSNVAARVPKSATVDLNGFRHASTFSLAFDFQDLPIDPRLLRAVGVEIHLGAVPEADFGTGMTSFDRNGARKSILHTLDAGGAPRADTLLLAGTVDTWTVEHTQTGSEVHMEGRDLRGILLDSPVNLKLLKRLDLSKPIAFGGLPGAVAGFNVASPNLGAALRPLGVVEQILADHPFGRDLLVEISPEDFPDSIIPSPYSKDGSTRYLQGADGKGSGSGRPAGGLDQVNYWDLITKYCFLCGVLPYFVGYKLLLRPARSIYDLTKEAGIDPRVPTPFKDGKDRTVQVGSPPRPDQLNIRRLVWGRDVASLKFERKYTGVKARVVECVSIDTSNKQRGRQQLISARWPDKIPAGAQLPPGAHLDRAKVTSVSSSGQLSEEELLRIPVPGVKDKKRLLAIAQDLFEEIGRGEMGGSCGTKNLASFGGDNSDPDLLHLLPGDPVEFQTDVRALGSHSNIISELTNQTRRSFEEQVAEIQKKIPDENLARIIVATARGSVVELQRLFRVYNVKYGWSKDSGVAIDFDFHNYVEARSGVTPQLGPNQKPTALNPVGRG